MSFFKDMKSSLHTFTADVREQVGIIQEAIQDEIHSHTHLHETCTKLHLSHRDNRFHSFAPQREGNAAKWFVDGCGYMWAVSVAIEEAKESIWILDWWLSPELYLRRPPSQNEKYRLDRMLLAAAERGVKVNIIVYKEVASVLTLCSAHTKEALEIHPNIAVFRHPDHVPSGQVLESSLESYVKKFSLNSLKLADIPVDAFKALYGMNNDVILYWAHHEKLCLIDGNIAFMGGLDLCFGRWDTNNHPIADAHPTDLNKILFPGQDFNNARVSDFEDVTHWDKNKLDRTKNSRMGWSDLSLCLRGPVVEDLRAHFVQRWNFIYNEKYDVQRDERYRPLTLETSLIPDGYYHSNGKNVKSIKNFIKPEGEEEAAEDPDKPIQEKEYHRFNLPSTSDVYEHYGNIKSHLKREFTGIGSADASPKFGEINVQLVRSCTRWSNGNSTEHSIANAYIEIIKNSQNFVYIENQFFITATDDAQHPVRNKIGAAIADRIIRAYQKNEKYKVIVCMPAVPAFAGDLHAEDSLGTRAIMEYQYNSICRGGHSIMEACQKAGVPDARKYIRFYNLRNYDRLNTGNAMAATEQASGVSYNDARKEHDDIVGAGYDGKGEGTGAAPGQSNQSYNRYQQAGAEISDGSKYDTISEVYMDSSPTLDQIPWSGSPDAEMDSFVSEELYIHTKLLIADDRIVICGSANLNDRSQLGYHDSEIAVIIEDPTPIASFMAGEPFTASAYATSLRRHLFRKHLGLLPAQDCTKPDNNFLPINKAPNNYDWDSPADTLVRDIMTREFDNLWNGTARVNTEVFAKAFHVVPADNVTNWRQYEKWYQDLFVSPSKADAKLKIPPKYQYGHVVKEEFPGGVGELKEWLGRVRGTLVEMPLHFMENVDFAVSGLKLNALTDDVYT